jgi:hypothetical protein
MGAIKRGTCSMKNVLGSWDTFFTYLDIIQFGDGVGVIHLLSVDLFGY